MRSISYALSALLVAMPVTAQTWQSDTGDSTALLYAGAFAPGGTTSFSCTTPSPQGVPLIETGDHEAIRTDTPFDMVVGFNIDLIDPFTLPNQLDNVRIILDDVPYPLPTVEYSDFYGQWTAWTQMSNGLFPALTRAQTMLVDTGTGTAYTYPTDGLSEAVLTAVNFCISGWAGQGHLAPRVLDAWTSGQLASAATPGPTPAPAPSARLPQSVVTAAGQGCPDETTSLTRDQLQIADLDADGAEDFILNHGAVRCTSGLNINCGAANCGIDVFLSSQGYQQPRQLLGVGVDLVPMTDGRTGLQISGTFSLCGETGLCPGPQVWNGTSFALP